MPKSNGKETDKDNLKEQAESGFIPKKAKVTFKKDNEYKSLYVNGAWGGLTSNKEIRMELYSELHSQAKNITYEISNKGALGKVLSREPEINIEEVELTRTLLAGITMQIETAESIANWLLEKVRQSKGGK